MQEFRRGWRERAPCLPETLQATPCHGSIATTRKSGSLAFLNPQNLSPSHFFSRMALYAFSVSVIAFSTGSRSMLEAP